jgi:hypothetical protein
MVRPSLTPARTGAMPGYNPANPVGIPGLVGGGGNVDPAAIQQGAVNVAQSMQSYISALPNVSEGARLATSGAQTVAAGQIAKASAEAEANAKLQRDNSWTAAQFGMTPGAADGTVATMSAAIFANERALDAKRAEILKKQDSSFFDNPVDWLFNQVALPYDIAAFNTMVGTTDHKLDVLKKLQDATKEGYQLNAGVDTANAAAVLAGQTQMALGTAVEKASEATFKAAQLGISETSVRMQATMDGFKAAVDGNAAAVAAEHLVLSKQGIAIQEKQLEQGDVRLALEKDNAARASLQAAVNLELSKLQLGDLKAKDEQLGILNDRLAKVAAIYKVNPVTYQQLQVMGDGPQKDFWMQGIMDPNLQEGGRIGFDTTDALQKMNAKNLPMTPAINYVRDKLITVRDNVILPQIQTWKSLSPDSQHLQVQNGIQAAVTKEVKNIPDAGGIYSPGTLASTLSIGTGEASLANTKIGAMLSPAARADPTAPTKASMILDTAKLLIQSGKATPAEMAEEINRIYTAIIVDNNNTRQYGLMSLKGLDPAIEGFKTSVQFGNSWGSRVPVNLTSKAAVEQVLTRMIIQDRLNDVNKGGTPGLF